MPASPSHSKVRVWPNRNATGLAMVLLAMAYAGASQSNGAAYLLCFVLAAVAAISAIHAWANVRGAAISTDPIPPVFAGEALSVTVVASSALRRDHFSIDVGKGRLASGARFDVIRAGETERGGITAPANARGSFTDLRIRVESVFPLGFFTARKIVTVRQTYFVYPTPGGALPLPSSAMPAGRPKGGLRVEGDDFSGLRAWLPGESQRHIDWKAASRGQPLLTKQWAGESDEILRFDWDTLAPLETEARLSQLTRWIIRAERSGALYALRLPKHHFPPSRGDRHLHLCLRALACFGHPDSAEAAAATA
jgi:uncharacterized protein (DUF58 family)